MDGLVNVGALEGFTLGVVEGAEMVGSSEGWTLGDVDGLHEG